jgi:hypothetical protein
MSQKKKCEFTHKRGAKIKTHIVFINPDLSRDRDFFVSPSRDGTTQRTSRSSPINKRDPMIAIDPQGRESVSLATRCIENPKVHLLTPYYKLSKESRFLNKKWRFGGGINPLDKPSAECAPQLLRGFFIDHHNQSIHDSLHYPRQRT